MGPLVRARRQARRFALQALYQWELSGDEMGEVERQFLAEHDLRRADVAYFRDLLQGVGLRAEELDGHLASCLDRPVAQLDPVERAILRLGTWELLSHPEVPYRVVIDEAVRLAKDFGAEQSHRYVNGVLDKLARRLRPVETGDLPSTG